MAQSPSAAEPNGSAAAGAAPPPGAGAWPASQSGRRPPGSSTARPDLQANGGDSSVNVCAAYDQLTHKGVPVKTFGASSAEWRSAGMSATLATISDKLLR